MYDWAFSGYSAISITVLVFYLQTVAVSLMRPAYAFGDGAWVTMMVAAVLSPILGAIADAQANKRAWLFWTTLIGSGTSALMLFATPDRAVLFVLLFLIAQ